MGISTLCCNAGDLPDELQTTAYPGGRRRRGRIKRARGLILNAPGLHTLNQEWAPGLFNLLEDGKQLGSIVSTQPGIPGPAKSVDCSRPATIEDMKLSTCNAIRIELQGEGPRRCNKGTAAAAQAAALPKHRSGNSPVAVHQHTLPHETIDEYTARLRLQMLSADSSPVAGSRAVVFRSGQLIYGKGRSVRLLCFEGKRARMKVSVWLQRKKAQMSGFGVQKNVGEEVRIGAQLLLPEKEYSCGFAGEGQFPEPAFFVLWSYFPPESREKYTRLRLQ